MTQFAPIALFVYNRPRHAQAVLTALAANPGAAESPLWIFCDGAKKADDLPQVEAVHKVVDQVSGFASIKIIKRQTNQGLAKSIINGTTAVLEHYDRIIVVEDDVVTSPHFLTFMNRSLSFYQDDPLAFSIGAWTYPSKSLEIPQSYPYGTYASLRCCSWGWAIWRDRWSGIDWSLDYFESFMADPARQLAFNRGGDDLTGMLAAQYHGKIDSWAIRFCYAHFVAGRHCIWPVKPLVHNMGLDNSGTHCSYDPDNDIARVDMNWSPQSLCPGDLLDQEIVQRFHRAASPVKRSIPQRAWRRLRSYSSRFSSKFLRSA
jgi:GNT-I family